MSGITAATQPVDLKFRILSKVQIGKNISNYLIQSLFLALVVSFSLIGLEAPGPRQNTEPTRTEQVYQARHQSQKSRKLLAIDDLFISPIDYSGALLFQEQKIIQELKISMKHSLPGTNYYKKTKQTTAKENEPLSDSPFA